MPENKTYSGGCHCGKVRYEVEAALDKVIACNCSLCAKAGWLLTFVTEDKVKFLSGGDDVTDYQFAKKHIHHTFCTSCGVRSFSRGAAPDGRMMYAINVRCLDGVELSAIEVKQFDGKSL
jgi:hypothetical protein